MDELEVKFAANLKLLRKSKNMKQSDLAKLLDVNQRTVSAWEHGICEPNFATLLKISAIFNESLTDLLT